MVWLAIEDAYTHEVDEFEQVDEKEARYLMDGYRVDKHNVTRFRLQDVEGDRNVIYDGVTYKGGFGYNLWVGAKYVEV